VTPQHLAATGLRIEEAMKRNVALALSAGTTVPEYIAAFTAGLNERVDRNDDQVVCWAYSPAQLASPKRDANPSNPYGFQSFLLIDNNNYGLNR